LKPISRQRLEYLNIFWFDCDGGSSAYYITILIFSWKQPVPSNENKVY